MPEKPPSLRHNCQSDANRTIPSPATNANPTFVADESSQITDETGLHYLFCAVFETATLTGESLRAYEVARANRAMWANRDAMLGEVRTRLIARLAEQTGNEEEILDCIKSLKLHLAKTKSSKEAYDFIGKPMASAMWWPNPTDPNHRSSIYDQLPVVATYPLITHETPIGSSGSCFAMEIAFRLQQDGYNYVITEPDTQPNGLSRSCTATGPIFNTPSFRQLVETAFGHRVLPKLLWTRNHRSERQYLDPFREDIVFPSVADFESTYDNHWWAVREAFLRCKVFVITLGMNEIWRMKSDGSVFSRAPWSVMPDLVEQHVMTVEENIQELQQMLDLLRLYNPDIQLIVSVSPVPLHATFRSSDVHVISANCHSKSTLRVAAEAFAAQNSGIYYFPSYETVMYCTREPWWDDQRHVSAQAVDNVMRLFRRMFVKDDGFLLREPLTRPAA
jgi:hypothetical protein